MAGSPTKRAPDAGDSGAIPSSFLRLILFPVGRRPAARPSAGNANRWALGHRIKNFYMNIIYMTRARLNFEYFKEDVSILLKTHDSETKRAAGRPNRDLEVFKRAGVILAVTAWEAYIEDTLSEQFSDKLEYAEIPADIKGAFNSVSQTWLNSQPKPPEVEKWTGEGWKNVVMDKFKHDVEALNTPNSENIKHLFSRYLDIDVTAHWKWQKNSSKVVCQKLDALIKLRGKLVHRGKELSESTANVNRKNFVEAKLLIERLVECTDKALNVAPKFEMHDSNK
jgi:hypothetical protein